MDYLIICEDKKYKKALHSVHKHMKEHESEIDKTLDEKGVYNAIVDELSRLRQELDAGDMKDAKDCLQCIASYAIMTHANMLEE